MAYSPPSLKVYQEFVPQLAGNTLPLYTCIIAPQYKLHRFAEIDEQALLGDYNRTSGNSYTTWPDKTAGSTIDVASSQVWVEDGVLEYYNFTLDGSAGNGLLTDDGNRVRSADLVFETANGVDRSAVYGTRNVQLGDYVKVQYGSTTLETAVAGLLADDDAAVVGSVSPYDGNQLPVASASAVVSEHIASSEFSVSASAAAYNGLADGAVEDVYTATVISTDGTLENTMVTIASASGNDDVATQALSGSGVAVPCGTRGATFTITASPALVSSSSDSSVDSQSNSSTSSASSITESLSSSSESSNIDRQLLVGDYWTVEVAQAFAPPSPVAGGTYKGIRDTTYLVSVAQGGTVGSSTIKLAPTTTNGYDSGALVTVTTDGAVSIGNYGVTLTLHTGEQYTKGDVFVIDATAAGKGAVHTLILADKLVGATTTDTLVITQGLVDTFELPLTEWTASETSITIAAAAEVVGTYTGTIRAFDLLKGTLFMDYRELLTENTTRVGSLNSISDVEDVLGAIDPSNPIALMVYAALLGSEGTDVYYIGVNEDTVDGYEEALEHLTDTAETYSLVPYNTSREVADIVEAHVEEMSSPDNALFRILWRGLDVPRLSAYYTELPDGSELLTTVNGTQALTPGASYLSEGVEAGDLLRINYHTDGVGNTIFDEYVVDHVVAEDEIALVEGPATPISIGIKSEIWRNASLNQYADNIAEEAIRTSNRRVTAIWAEPISLKGFTNLSNTYLAALLAGMRSAGAPHQPMSLMEVPYIDMDVQTNFGATQLNKMASNGVWLVVQDVDGTIYTRHQVTTDPFDVFTREQTITTNLDHISRDYKTAVSDLYGRGNVSDSMLKLIEGRIDSTTTAITGRIYSEIIGPQMESIKITRLEADPVLRDQVWVEMDVVLPVPMNHLVLKFRLI